MPPFPFRAHFLRALDVCRLAALVGAAQQKYGRFAVSAAAHPAAGAKVNAQLNYSFSERLAVARIARLHLPQANLNRRLG